MEKGKERKGEKKSGCASKNPCCLLDDKEDKARRCSLFDGEEGQVHRLKVQMNRCT